jgi:hypothetical protein
MDPQEAFDEVHPMLREELNLTIFLIEHDSVWS